MMSSPLTGDIFQLIGNCDIWFDASLCVALPCLASLLQVELRLERDTTATIANVLSTFESLDIVRTNVISDHHCVISKRLRCTLMCLVCALFPAQWDIEGFGYLLGTG